jgi:hypothetical protein
VLEKLRARYFKAKSLFLVQKLFLIAILLCFVRIVEGEIIDVNFSDPSVFVAYEHNYYAFRVDSNHSVYLSTSLGIDYNGSEVFNNGATGPNEYLLFSPDQNSSRNWYIYDPNDLAKVKTIQVVQYSRKGPNYSSDLVSADEFGYSIAVNDWNQTLVGTPGDSQNLGALYVFEKNASGVLSENQKIVPSLSLGESNRTKFGASLDTFASNLIIGAPDAENYSGKAYHYERLNGNYTLNTQIIDPNGTVDEQFGYSVAYSPTGNEVAISSPHLKNDGIGKVSIFSYNSPNWTLSNQVWSNLDRNESGDSFGYEIAMGSNFLVVGAPEATVGENTTGQVYVYNKEANGSWNGTPQVLSPAFLSDGDQFGHRVAVVGDIIFIGAKYGDDNRSDVGSVYVFELSGGTWMERTKLNPPNNFSSQVFSQDLVAMDNLLVVSATGIGEGGISYVFKMGNDSTNWNLISSLENNETNVTNATFSSLAIAPGIIVLGTPEDSSQADVAGSFQAFYNLGWQLDRQQQFPPMFVRNTPSSLTMVEDEVGGFKYDFNATHPFDGNFSWSIVSFNATGGAFDINQSSGLFSFQPIEHFNGTLDLEIQVSLPEGIVTKNFGFVVTPQPDAPVFLEQNSTLPYAMVGDEYSFEISASDVDGDSLTFSAISGMPDGLSFIGNKLSGTPLWSAVGNMNYVDYALNIEITDGGLTAQRSFDLRVYKQNSPPRFVDGNGTTVQSVSIQMSEDFTQTNWIIAMPNLSLVDDDPSNSGFSLSLVSAAGYGSVFLDPNASDGSYIIYDSIENFNGDDNFTVRLIDSNNPSKHSDLDFNVTILPVNDPPVINSAPNSLLANEGVEFVYDLSVGDPDLNDTYSLTVLELPSWLEFNQTAGRISGTPEWNDYSETVSYVSIIAEDASGSTGSQEFGLSVVPLNYPPSIVQGRLIDLVIDEDEYPTAWTSLELNATDQDTPVSQLSWALLTSPSNGTVSWNSEITSIFIDYVPDGNFTGIDQFVFEVSDINDSRIKDQVLVNVTISSIPDDPLFVPLAKFTDAVIGYHWTYEFEAIDGDKNQSLTIQTKGEFPDWLNLSSVRGDQGRYQCKLEGTPKQKDLGSYELTLEVVDEIGAVREQVLTVSAISENYLPVIIEGDSKQVLMTEDTVLYEEYPLTLDELNNQKIEWKFSAHPNHGTGEINFQENGILNYIRYTPDGNFSGNDSFSIEVSDGIATDEFSYFIEVENVNDAPVFETADLSFSLKEGNQFELDVFFNDGDGLDDATPVIMGAPSWLSVDQGTYLEGKIVLSGTPTESDEENSSIQITLTDKALEVDTFNFSLSVYVLNHSPTLSKSSISVQMTEDVEASWRSSDNLSIFNSITANDVETASNNLIWGIFSSPNNGTAKVDLDGSNLFYLPDANFSGLDSFTIGVTDESVNGDFNKTSFLSVDVQVQAVNDSPVFTSDPMNSSLSSQRVVWSDEFEMEYRVSIYDSDGVGDNSHVLSTEGDFPSWMTFLDYGNGTGLLKGQGGIKDEGIYRLHLKARDLNGSEANQNFFLYFVVDDYPPRFESVLNGISLETVNLFMDEDSNLTEWRNPTSFKAVNPDPEIDDYDSILWSVHESPTSGGSLNASGSGGIPSLFQYSPPQHFNGMDYFTLKLDEGDRYSLLRFLVNINSIPDSPIIISELDQKIYVEAGVPFSKKIIAEDPDSSNLHFQLIAPFWDAVPWLRITEQNASGTVEIGGTPRVSPYGNHYNFNIIVMDETGRFENKPLNIYVEGTNQKPTISRGDEVTIRFDQDGNPIGFLLNELSSYDPEGDLLSWSVPTEGEPSFGSVEVEGNGSYPSGVKYFPNTAEITEDYFTLRVSDGRKHDDILVQAIVSWDDSLPFITQPEDIVIYEGEAFLQEILVSSSNNLETFSHELVSAPAWLTIRSNGNKAFIEGEAHYGSKGTYEIEFQANGARNSSHSVSFNLVVKSLSLPQLELLGGDVMMLSKDEVFNDPGFLAVDQKTAENVSHLVEVNNSDVINEFDIRRIQYTLGDESGIASSQTRIVRQYGEAPMRADKILSIDSLNPVSFGWSLGEDINVWGSGIKTIIDWGTGNENNFTNNLCTWLKSHKSSDNQEVCSSIISGDEPAIMLVESLVGLGTVVAGTFGNQIEVFGKKIVSEYSNNIFVACVGDNGIPLWIKTFGGDATFSECQLILKDDGNILLLGIFNGGFTVGPLQRSLNSSANQLFALSISPSGEFQDLKGINGSGVVSLVNLFESNKAFFLVLNINDEGGQGRSGSICKFDHDFLLIDEISVKSEKLIEICSAAIDGNDIWIGGKYQGVLSVDQIDFVENPVPNGFIFNLNQELDINFGKFIDSTIDSRISSLSFDYWNNPIAVIEFSGKVYGFGEVLESTGESDLLVFKFIKENGNVIWQKQIGGPGNDKDLGLEVSETGSIALLVETSESFDLDGFELNNSTHGGDFKVISFVSDLGVPLHSVSKVELNSIETHIHRVDVINSNEIYFELVESPPWVSLLGGKDGQTYASLLIKPQDAVRSILFEEGYEIVLRAFNLEGDFSDRIISFKYTQNQSGDFLMGRFPDPDPLYDNHFSGDGQVCGLFTKNTNEWVIAVNNASSLNVLGHSLNEISETSNPSSIIYVDENSSQVTRIDLESTDKVLIAECKLDDDGYLYALGNYGGQLSVLGNNFVSEGGQDIFLLKLNEKGEFVDFQSFGSFNDEFAKSLELSDGSVYLGVEYIGYTKFLSDYISANGFSECLLAKLQKTNLAQIEWVKTVGGNGKDKLNDIELLRNDELLVCGSFAGKFIGRNGHKDVGTSGEGIFLQKVDSNGTLLHEFLLSGSGRIRNGKVISNSSQSQYTLACEFEGNIEIGNQSLVSDGGFDLLIASFSTELASIMSKRMGGEWNERLQLLEMDGNEKIVFAATFFGEIDLDGKVLIAQGSSDAFLARLSLEKLDVLGTFHLAGNEEDRIDFINFISPQDIHLLGTGGTLSLNTSKKGLFWSRLGDSSLMPSVLDLVPVDLPASRAFQFSLRTGPWTGGNKHFFLSEDVDEQLYEWMDISILLNGQLDFKGITPSGGGTYPFDFKLHSSSGEIVQIAFDLDVIDSLQNGVLITLPEQIEVFQYEKSKVSVYVNLTNLKKSAISIKAPDWVTLGQVGADGSVELILEPNDGKLGVFDISLSVFDSLGRVSNKALEAKVFPRLKADLGTENEDEVTQGSKNIWQQNWFGSYRTFPSAWTFHYQLGWIFLQPSKTGSETWFWSEKSGWLWTSSELWNPDGDSFMFKSTTNDWLLFRNPLIFDYSIGEWVNL